MEKNNKKIEIISFIVLVILILTLALTLYLRRNSIVNINRVLSNKFDEVKCVNEDCNYLSVYDKSKNMVYIYDSYGAKLGKYKNSSSKALQDVTSNYMIFKKLRDDGSVRSYSVLKYNGKEVYNSKNELNILTDYLVSEKNGEETKIINNNGDVLYNAISDLKRYKNVSSITVSEKEYLIDDRGDRILTDYVVEKEVYDVDDEENLMYLILKDSSNAFYYFDVEHEKIKGTSFVKYEELDEDNNLVIYKNINGEKTKYILYSNGNQEEDEEESQLKLMRKFKNDIDKKYSIYSKSLHSTYQSEFLVDNKEDNSFGIYEIKTKEYKKLYDYTKENGNSIILNFDSYDGNKYIQAICSKGTCENDTIIVFDIKNGKVLFTHNSTENSVKDYTGLKGGYKIIKYTLDSSEEFKDKYVLYDSKNNIVTSSTKMITVVDRKVIFGKKYKYEPSILYSVKLKKVLNTEDTLAELKKVNKVKMYKYEDDENINIVSNKGNILYKINKEESNLFYAKEAILDVSEKRVKMVDAKRNKVGEYKFEKNETLLTNSSQNTVSFKNSIFVNNTKSNYGKIVDYSGSKIKLIKKSLISEVNASKKTGNIIVITTNGKKFGFYIAK